MILVDTSVLINYLREIENNKTAQYKDILDKNIPFGINNYIYQELLQGCLTEKDFKLLKKYLDGQKFYSFKNGKESYANAAKIFFGLRRKGITVRSTIDCLIAQMAIENDLYLLHDDTDFERIQDVTSLKIWDN